METAMCDSLPPTKDPPENYYVDNIQKSVGEIVTVFCKNVTVAVIQCMPDLKWNATVPACSTDKAQNTMATLLIIVWAVGAVLLVALVILIVLIVSYRSKNGCRSRGNSSPTSSVFHISGGRREGGDNLAFTRADERCGEWSFHRAADFRDSTRLPSYQEAILNNYITFPTAAGNLSHPERTNFIRANTPPSYSSSQHQSVAAAPDSVTVTSINAPDPQIPTAEENPRPSAETPLTNEGSQQLASSSVSSRYAENYPQCFFQEEPPPPYTPGPTNYNIYRSPVRQPRPQRGEYNRRGICGTSQSYSPQNDSIHLSNVRRSTHERARTPQRQNQISTDPAHQQINYDLLHSSQNTIPFAHQSVSSQSDSGYQSPMTNLMPSNSSTSHSSHNQCCLNQSNSLTCQRSSVPTRDNSNCFPSALLGNERLIDSNNEPSQRETLYIVRNSHPTPTAPIYPSSSQLFQFDGQPIGTSTPLTQSPLAARKFFPDSHPSPQSMSHFHHPLSTSQPQHSLPQQEPYIFYTGSRSQSVCQSQTVLTADPMFSPYSNHFSEGSAPIARLDVDCF